MKPIPIDDPDAFRKAAIAVAIERTSDPYPKGDEWLYDYMYRNGVLLSRSCSSLGHAEYEVTIARLGIAADILRLDIREIMNRLHALSTDCMLHPESAPPVGTWTNWLPKASEVLTLLERGHYFDVNPW